MIDTIGIPLKNTGFQKKRGAIPHFKNMENIKKNHIIPIVNTLLNVVTCMKYRNTCSNKNQSNVIRFSAIQIKKMNKFREDNNDTQNKKIIEFKKV